MGWIANNHGATSGKYLYYMYRIIRDNTRTPRPCGVKRLQRHQPVSWASRRVS